MVVISAVTKPAAWPRLCTFTKEITKKNRRHLQPTSKAIKRKANTCADEKEQYHSIDFEKIVSWKRRMKIAEDIATALAYLHTAFSTPFVYRTMDIGNILIDEDGVAKLTDFSCCISIPQGEKLVKVNFFSTDYNFVGTVGYIDPVYLKYGIVSEKTDVYGFGMFMLMLLIGVGERLDELAEEHDSGIHLENPMWMSEYIEEGRLVDKIADPKMLKNMVEVTEEERCKMNAFYLLSVRCFGCKGVVPTMVEVAKELKKIHLGLFCLNSC